MKVVITESIAAAIQAIVTRSGMSRDEVASKSQVCVRTLYYVLRGNSQITLRTIVSILQVLGADVDDFLERHFGIRRPKPAGQVNDPHAACSVAPGAAPAATSPDALTVAKAIDYLAAQFRLTPAQVSEALLRAVSGRDPPTGIAPPTAPVFGSVPEYVTRGFVGKLAKVPAKSGGMH